jgi:hypothetical protein
MNEQTMTNGYTHLTKTAVSAAVLGFSSLFLSPSWADSGDPTPREGIFEGIDRINIFTGIDYSSGDYGSGSADTDILYLYGAGEVEVGRWRARVTVPWIDIDGPGGVTGGPGDPVVVGSGGAGTTSNSGIGDIVLEAGYLFGTADSSLPYIELVGKIKLPTADEDKGLGTGKTDFSVQADAFKTIEDLTVFGTLGFKVFGDPAGFNLNNAVFISAGASQRMNRAFSFGGSLDWREATSRFSSDRLELSPFASYHLTESMRLTGYGVVGLSNGSPDLGGGAALKVSF